MVGMYLFYMHKSFFMDLCAVYVGAEYGIIVYICRCYYSACALSDTGDASLEFNLCHKHTGQS